LFDSNIVEIPIEAIKSGLTLKNIRTWFDEKSLVELANSIHRDGLMNPLVIMESEDDDGNTVIELVAGERRLRAIQYIRGNLEDNFMDSGIPCITYVGTTAEAKFVNASENIDRDAVDDVDVAYWVHARIDEGVTQTELATKLHKTLQWVNFRVLFHERASDEVKKALREGLISFTAGYELSKAMEADEQNKFIKKFRTLNRKISVEDARGAGKKQSQKPGKKQRDEMLILASDLSSGDDPSVVAKGVLASLQWVDGKIQDTELKDLMGWDGDGE
jgi:ParB family chromosome partitioning protein